MAAHARLFPASSSADLMVCPARAVMSLDYKRETNLAAATGTMQHEICQRVYTSKIDLEEFLGSTVLVDGYQIQITQAHITNCQYYLDYLDQTILETDTVMIEHKMPLSLFTNEEGANCTADCLILRNDPVRGIGLIVIDAKFGQHKVDVGSQLHCYLATARRIFNFTDDIEWFEATIVQPPIDHIHSETYTLSQLIDLEAEILIGINRVFDAKAELRASHFNPGSKACGFCPAAGVCRPYKDHCLKSLDEDAMDPFVLSEQEVAELYVRADAIEGYLKAVKRRVNNDVLDSGKRLPGLKVVRGRQGDRKWDCQNSVERILQETLGDEAYKRTLLSPKQAEDRIGKTRIWEDLSSHITRSEGPLIVVPDSDNRPEINSGITSEEMN